MQPLSCAVEARPDRWRAELEVSRFSENHQDDQIFFGASLLRNLPKRWMLSEEAFCKLRNRQGRIVQELCAPSSVCGSHSCLLCSFHFKSQSHWSSRHLVLKRLGSSSVPVDERSGQCSDVESRSTHEERLAQMCGLIQSGRCSASGRYKHHYKHRCKNYWIESFHRVTSEAMRGCLTAHPN